MISELLGVVLIFLLTIVLAIPLGRYIAKVYSQTPTLLDPVFGPIERAFFRLSGIQAHKELSWQENMIAMLTINLLWFLLSMLILMNQGWLPWNPDANPSMSADLAFNTAISFVVNCNLQHYSGETGMSYLGQVFCLMYLQFVTPATGMAAAAAVFKAMRPGQHDKTGNFYNFFVLSITRILLPLSLVVALLLLANGTPMNLEGKQSLVTLQGDTVQVARGPVAAFVGIKQIGTNGGGFFGTNSAHPLENPNYFTNAVESIAILLVPIALVFAFGFYLQRKRLAWMVFGVMTICFLMLLIPAILLESKGMPQLTQLGINQPTGSLEGKEIRFGSAASAYWAIATTATSNGSVNAMHDSLTPLTGMLALLGMMINAIFGGVGCGFLNFYIFLILAVFISGLMVGRTPEWLGKKIEAREMKIAMIVALFHPFLILAGTALACYLYQQDPSVGWLNNPSFHGFSEMLYEFTSSSANNGSGFEGLGDNNPFWNISTGIVLLLSRFLPLIGPVAIAGLLAQKKQVPESAGTLQTDTATFGVMVFAVMMIVAALSFFPALALGPLAEYF
ncbi:MAG: potassium-transporting ATPase subunit KdpA [Spirosomataceae bacterium]